MCGNYHFKLEDLMDIDEFIAKYEKWKKPGDQHEILFESYHIRPTDIAPVIVKDENGELVLKDKYWYLMAWPQDKPNWKYRTFNARKDKLTILRTWKSVFPSKRCVIPINGFFEWTGPRSNRIPHFIYARDGSQYLYMAGLYSNFSIHDGLGSYSMITVEANEFMKPLHPNNRMPAFLHPSEINDWLNPDHT